VSEDTALVRSTLAAAGIDVSDDDLPLVTLVQAGVLAQVAALDDADPARFPFEPLDPSRAPDPA
jgi:hypothetical protein